MGGGVSSLPAEVSLAEAKELAGAGWQPAWEEKFAEAKISRDEAIQCWKESEAEGRDLRGALRKAPRHQPFRRCGGAGFSAIVPRNAGSTCPARANGSSRRCSAGGPTLIGEALLACGWRRHGKSVAAAELLARLLDKQNAAAWHFCKHRAGAVRASGAVAVSGGHAVRDGGGLRRRAEGERQRRDRQG